MKAKKKNNLNPEARIKELTLQIGKLYSMNPIDIGLIESLKTELRELVKSKRISPTVFPLIKIRSNQK